MSDKKNHEFPKSQEEVDIENKRKRIRRRLIIAIFILWIIIIAAVVTLIILKQDIQINGAIVLAGLILTIIMCVFIKINKPTDIRIVDVVKTMNNTLRLVQQY